MTSARSLSSFRRLAAFCATLLLLGGCAALPSGDAADSLRAAETSFARSMADRNFDAFAAHVADDAVFINGGKPLRGKAEVLAFWKRFFDQTDAPFSWRPEIAEVAGNFGYTTGPVMARD